MIDLFTADGITGLFQVMAIDLVLAGDNAVVIALACRSLPENQRKLGIILGAGTAVGLRIIFAWIISELLEVPFLKLAGGLLLFWIAIKLIYGDEEEKHIEAGTSLWRAVRTIAIADAVMSLDNVVAIAAAAGEHKSLFIFGLLLSIPLIMLGSTLIMSLIQRFPIFVWAGAALLGWIAGEMLVGDPFILNQLGESFSYLDAQKMLHPIAHLKYSGAFVGALFVLAVAWYLTHKRQQTPKTF